MTARRTSLSSVGLLLLPLLLTARLAAHDFWIEPSSFTPAENAAVGFHLRVGQQWQGDPFPRNSQRILKFVLAGPDGVTDIAGAEAVDPAGLARVGSAGLYTAGYTSSNAELELEPAKFEEYLRLEGLEWVISERARRHESATPSREVYARCAKSLLRVGTSAAATGFDRLLGFTLELVPEQDPSAAHAGDSVVFRLLYGGRPLPGALVAAAPKAHPEALVSARSDAAGRVRLRFGESGVWLVKAVHMKRLERDASAPAGTDPVSPPPDWQSTWASFTFAIP